MEQFKKRFQIFIEGLTGDQIFNCDETGLNFKMLPGKSLAARTEKAAPGYKRSKERVTILACSNATANLKLDLTMIGKSKNPRAFKIITKQTLPVKYFNQKSAWMSSKLEQGLELSHDIGAEVSETTFGLFNSSIDKLLTHFDHTNDLSTGNESIQINEFRHKQTNDDSLDISRPNTFMQIDEPGSWHTIDQSSNTSTVTNKF